MTDCICAPVYAGSTLTGSYNWNPDCYQHGVGSEWYTSDEQVERRRVQSARLRDLANQRRRQRGLPPLEEPDGADPDQAAS